MMSGRKLLEIIKRFNNLVSYGQAREASASDQYAYFFESGYARPKSPFKAASALVGQ
jgi:hypothetical protein